LIPDTYRQSIIAVAKNMFRLTSAEGRYGVPGQSLGEDWCPALHDGFRWAFVGRVTVPACNG